MAGVNHANAVAGDSASAHGGDDAGGAGQAATLGTALFTSRPLPSRTPLVRFGLRWWGWWRSGQSGGGRRRWHLGGVGGAGLAGSAAITEQLQGGAGVNAGQLAAAPIAATAAILGL